MLTIETRHLRKDPVNRLSFFENTVPAKKFLLWKEQLCRQMGDLITPPSDYWWYVSLPLVIKALEFV
jgi:hypothetical protein